MRRAPGSQSCTRRRRRTRPGAPARFCYIELRAIAVRVSNVASAGSRCCMIHSAAQKSRPSRTIAQNPLLLDWIGGITMLPQAAALKALLDQPALQVMPAAATGSEE